MSSYSSQLVNEYIEKIANVSIKTHFFAVAVFTCWRHMQRQYFMMAYPRPQTLVLDVESVMRELLERDPNLRDNVKDSPPKYEDIASEESPPQYDEKTMMNEESSDDQSTNQKS